MTNLTINDSAANVAIRLNHFMEVLTMLAAVAVFATGMFYFYEGGVLASFIIAPIMILNGVMLRGQRQINQHVMAQAEEK